MFTVDGIELPLDEDIFNQIRDKFKENVEISEWTLNNLKGKYNEKLFLQKADEYFKLHDYVQAHEKLWAAAGFSVKEFCLILGVKLSSHNAKKHAVKMMAEKLNLGFDRRHMLAGKLEVGWKTAERCHASFNELLSTSPEEWIDKITDVRDFTNIINDLKSNKHFNEAFFTMLVNVPTSLICQKLFKTQKEVFGDKNYEINYKIFDKKVI